MFDNDEKGIIFLEFLFLLISVIYTYNLNGLNQILKRKNIMEIMWANNGSAWFFLVGAAILCFFGIVLIYICYNNYSFGIFFSILVINLVILCLIVYLIQNPILRGLIVVIIFGTAVTKDSD